MLASTSNVVVMATCPIILAEFSLENFHEINYSKSDKAS